MDCYTDDELVYLMRCGYQEAEECLYRSYYQKIRWWITPLCWSNYCGLDLDDYMQMMMVHLEKIIASYRDDRKASLKTFVKLSVKKRIPSILKSGTDSRIYRDNILISLDDYVSHEEGMRYDEIVEDSKSTYQPEIMLMIKEQENYYHTKLADELSIREHDVMEYKRTGYTEEEIANILQISLRSVYNAVYRYHKKVLSIDVSK